MEFFAVANATYLSTSLTKALRFGQILGHSEFKTGHKDAICRYWVPNMDSFLVVGAKHFRVRVVQYPSRGLVVVKVVTDCALREFKS